MSLTPSRKSIPAAIAGIAVVVVAGWLGIDLSHNGASSTIASTNTTSAAPAKSQAPKPSAVKKSAPAATSSPTISTKAKNSGYEECPVSTLTDEADQVITEILVGGPFEYPDNDGVRFGNYEGVLPQESRNYYREYTVDTPGLNHRGERRIVTGGGSKTDPDVWYYTEDHYETFCLIPDAEQ